MSNDSASSIIIKDSKLQSMTNFPLRSAFEFPVSSQSQRVMCAKKKKEFVKNLLLLVTTYIVESIKDLNFRLAIQINAQL